MRFREQLDIIEYNKLILGPTRLHVSLVNSISRQINAIPDEFKVGLEKINKRVQEWRRNEQNLTEFKKMDKLPYLKKNYQNLKRFFEEGDEITSQNIKGLNIFLENLFLNLESVETAINISLPKAKDKGISIKTPDFSTLNESVEFFNSIQKVFNLIYGNDDVEDREIRFSNFDTGSNWVEIIISATAGVRLLDYAIRSVFTYIREIQNIKIVNEKLKTVKMEEPLKRNIIKQVDDDLQNSVVADFKSHLDKDSKISDTSDEYLNRAYKGIELLSKLMEQGTAFEETKKTLDDSKKRLPSVSNQQQEIKKLLSKSKQNILSDSE